MTHLHRSPDDARTAVGQLLGLLRTGEQSAHLAFRRLSRRLPPASARYAQHALSSIAIDEATHDQWLATAADSAGIFAIPAPVGVRRFFVKLESRDIRTHLVRIAALDACVCQILSCVLAARRSSCIPPALLTSLAAIRRDEAVHVRTTRGLAREFGVDPVAARALQLETRGEFGLVLAHYGAAFDALGVDAGMLQRRISRRDT